MSSRSLSRSSISKQRGAEMSSRLMPPKLRGQPDDRLDDLLDVGGVEADWDGVHAAEPLKRTALPSMTGIAAAGPMSPSPSTAVPSVTTATTLGTHV